MSFSKQPTDINLIWENDFLQIFDNKVYRCGIVIAKEEYIPIEDFKIGFDQAGKLAIKKKWKAIIFDKSNLTVFHQPSMVWYYTEWKKELAENGLKHHFKILPKESWFKASVEAGIKDIKQKQPNFDFDAFKVSYVDNVNEAFKQLSRN